MLLCVQGLSKSFSKRPLFEGLSFGLFEGEKTGLIGPNGTGKSSLLRILAGLDAPDEGEVVARKGLRVAYLAQQDRTEDAANDRTVREELLHALATEEIPGYEREARADSGLVEAGFFDPAQPVSKLSGGWRKRLAILAQVLRAPDLLLLDEPTNHLDLEGVLWLEDFLRSLRFSYLVVTHDRRFLASSTNRVIELSGRYEGGCFSIDGDYAVFLEKREQHLAHQNAKEAAVRNTVRREIEWLRRGAKARSTKQNARIERAGELISELGELEYRNDQDRRSAIDFSGSERKTRRLVQLKGVAKSLGGRALFSGLDLELAPGDKLGLLGANGSGKSTLLKILNGSLEQDFGSLRRADQLRVETFDQHREQLDLEWPLRRALCENGDTVYYRDAKIHVAGWATRFLFDKSRLDEPLKLLSGGEQSRVLIARLMLRPADVLLLDEPTNDLDIASLEVLESSLMEFPGALVLVTHDRFLLDRVSDRLLALDGAGGHDFFADLSQWEDREAARSAAKRSRKREGAKPSSALSYAERKELGKVEGCIAKAETALAAAREALMDPAFATDAGELQARQRAVDAAQAELDALLARWEELESRS
ncbi:MAG: ABC transporter ATP-binding protein [Elusimicrobia bacterium CG_4_9_14_3_um_filter_62_55]|nr:MAG: ABC transporter ATP-binding protein [Elusimicrobia bacterium CG22_combo_CG10-13_8_21_14_all_63_91]PJA18778.1 MAG: ABC transporter ATP-binding protein [Elusimicrobia bacterium CG_4_10_14_0_2_um_filter_63_34]PJB24986.1 MAG: ABC transporter ATP-binding protein [Elusimicrobia bacterium CG_4_9_14_3_um_filter_62_55]